MKMVKGRLLMAALLLGILLCVGCGKEAVEDVNKQEGSAEEIPEELSSKMEGSIGVVKNLPDREIEVPDYLKESDESIEDAEKTSKHLSGKEQAEKARQIAVHIKDSINEVLADKDFYPNITGITVNSECTEFNVTLSSRTISLYENVLPMSLCIVGNKFQLYQGKEEDELMTVVNYIDESSGEIFATTNSKDIK